MTDAIAEVRRLMRQRDKSLRATAQAAGYDASYLSKILNGKKPWNAHVANRLDDALGADGKIKEAPAPTLHIQRPVKKRSVALTPSGLPYNLEASDELRSYDISDTEAMRRRAFLVNVAALAGLSASSPTAAVEAIRHETGLSITEQR